MNWKTIRLELAATDAFPKGSVGRGFLIRAPMDAEGRIDEQSFLRTPHRAKVRRVWPNEPDESGKLVRLNGHWALRFDGKADRLIDADSQLQSGEDILLNSEGEQSPYTVRIFD
jgi:hypothetical protein